MKILKKLILPALLLSVSTAMAQDPVAVQNAKGKWGFADASGKVIIDYKYDETEGFINGRARVKKGDDYGYIDIKGKPIIPIKYQELIPFDQYSFRAATNGKVKDEVLYDEKWGFIDLDGKELLKCEYDEIGEFGPNGIAYVKKDDNFGYINRRFDFVVPCKFKAVGKWNKDGRVWVCEGGKAAKDNSSVIEVGKLGIYDENGNVIIEPKYASLGTFMNQDYTEEDLESLSAYDRKYSGASSMGHKRENKRKIVTRQFSPTPECGDMGYFYSSATNSFKNGISDAQGKEIVKPGQYDLAWYPSENFVLVLKGNNLNFLNLTTGKLMSKKGYANAFCFRDGYAIIQETPLTGWKLIDNLFHDATTEYLRIFPYADRTYRVHSASGFGLISSAGKELVKPEMSYIGECKDDRMAFCRMGDKKYGYIDTTGKEVIPARFDDVNAFEHGKAKVKVDDKWGMIDPSGSFVIEPKWTIIGPITSADQKNFWVGDATDRLMHLYSTETGNYKFPQGFHGVTAYDSYVKDFAMIREGSDGKVGSVDLQGNIVIPVEFNEIEHVVKAHGVLEQRPEGTEWKVIDTYRLKQTLNPDITKGKLSDTIAAELWDF